MEPDVANREQSLAGEPGRRERNKLQKRARIVMAARDLFQRHGFAETTTQQIAATADIGTGTLFLYAHSKEDLLIMVFKDEMLATVRAIYAGLSPHATTVERLMSVFDRMADYHATDADLSRILLKELVIPSSPERTSDIAELMDAILDGLTAVLGDDPLISQRDAALTARSAFALYYFALISWLGSGFDRNWCMRMLREQLSLLLREGAGK
ncbi:TetR/AcrR family transcriptional regulator [Sphingomonas sp.]|uniref:TetR/AcrR family transcriptional regulator n=1 Tax=Sphingomonas sp. TaxID=28214 RepID=UPI003CC6128E